MEGSPKLLNPDTIGGSTCGRSTGSKHPPALKLPDRVSAFGIAEGMNAAQTFGCVYRGKWRLCFECDLPDCRCGNALTLENRQRRMLGLDTALVKSEREIERNRPQSDAPGP